MTSVLGREVTGEITRHKEDKAEQWPGEKLLPLLDAVLALPNVHSVKWTQYTPYFNDGEPCIFRVNEVGVRLDPAPVDAEEDYDEYLDSYEMVKYPNGYRGEPVPIPGCESVWPVVTELNEALPHLEDFLEESFGDHATVVATQAGFEVEFYEHD